MPGPFIPPDESGGFGVAAFRMMSREERDHRSVTWSPREEHVAPHEERERLRGQAADVFRDSYESCMASLDRQIGELFEELEHRNLLEDTLVIVTSDHGEHFSERGFFGHGRSLYRPEVHVPLLIFDPSSRTPGLTIAEPVSLRDIALTASEWAKGPGVPAPFPGRSLRRSGAEPGIATAHRPHTPS